MKIKLQDGRKLFIIFRYDYTSPDRKSESMTGTQAELEVTEINGVQKTYFGYAKVHPKEVPNRVIGRKIALRYALKRSDFSYEERSEIWSELVKKGMKLFKGTIKITEEQLKKIYHGLSAGWERLDLIDPQDEQREVDTHSGEEYGVAVEKEEISTAMKLVERLQKGVK